jgi:hypothetical protein
VGTPLLIAGIFLVSRLLIGRHILGAKAGMTAAARRGVFRKTPGWFGVPLNALRIVSAAMDMDESYPV